MKKLAIVIFLILFTQLSVANNGDKFPNIKCETLDDKIVEILKVSEGKYCLIGMTSSRKAETDLKTWMQSVYDLFVNQNTFIPIDYDMNIFFVLMFLE